MTQYKVQRDGSKDFTRVQNDSEVLKLQHNSEGAPRKVVQGGGELIDKLVKNAEGAIYDPNLEIWETGLDK